MGTAVLHNGLVPALHATCRGFLWCTGLKLACFPLRKQCFHNVSKLVRVQVFSIPAGIFFKKSHWHTQCYLNTELSKIHGRYLVRTTQYSSLIFCVALFADAITLSLNMRSQQLVSPPSHQGIKGLINMCKHPRSPVDIWRACTNRLLEDQLIPSQNSWKAEQSSQLPGKTEEHHRPSSCQTIMK